MASITSVLTIRNALACGFFVYCLQAAGGDGPTEAQKRQARAHYRQAVAYEQGSSEWLALLERAIALNPDDAAVLRTRAVWEIKTGSYIRCFQLLDRAVALDPEIFGYRASLKLFSLRDYAGALPDLAAFDALHPGPDFLGDYTVSYCFGLAYKGLGRYREAVAAFDRDLAELSARGEAWLNPFTYFYRGICKRELQDPQGALADFSRMLALRPNSPEAYFQTGLTLRAMGAEDAACRPFKQAADLFFANVATDGYLERFDQLYWEDIEAALQACP